VPAVCSYEDGDGEDAELAELLPILVGPQRPAWATGAAPAAAAPKRRGRAPKQQQQQQHEGGEAEAQQDGASQALRQRQRQQQQPTLTGGQRRRATSGGGADAASGSASGGSGGDWVRLEPTAKALAESREEGGFYQAGGAGHERGATAFDSEQPRLPPCPPCLPCALLLPVLRLGDTPSPCGATEGAASLLDSKLPACACTHLACCLPACLCVPCLPCRQEQCDAPCRPLAGRSQAGHCSGGLQAQANCQATAAAAFNVVWHRPAGSCVFVCMPGPPVLPAHWLLGCPAPLLQGRLAGKIDRRHLPELPSCSMGGEQGKAAAYSSPYVPGWVGVRIAADRGSWHPGYR
jgi:hypothetical protein